MGLLGALALRSGGGSRPGVACGRQGGGGGAGRPGRPACPHLTAAEEERVAHKQRCLHKARGKLTLSTAAEEEDQHRHLHVMTIKLVARRQLCSLMHQD